MRVRKPTSADLPDALADLVSLRHGPPMLVSAALVVLLTGSLLHAALAIGAANFALAFWLRLCVDDE